MCIHILSAQGLRAWVSGRLRVVAFFAALFCLFVCLISSTSRSSNVTPPRHMCAVQCGQRAQLNLLDEGLRPCLEASLVDDRRVDIAALKCSFPSVDQVGFRTTVVLCGVLQEV